jgi:hypothetical protein
VLYYSRAQKNPHRPVSKVARKDLDDWDSIPGMHERVKRPEREANLICSSAADIHCFNFFQLMHPTFVVLMQMDIFRFPVNL